MKKTKGELKSQIAELFYKKRIITEKMESENNSNFWLNHLASCDKILLKKEKEFKDESEENKIILEALRVYKYNFEQKVESEVKDHNTLQKKLKDCESSITSCQEQIDAKRENEEN